MIIVLKYTIADSKQDQTMFAQCLKSSFLCLHALFCHSPGQHYHYD